MKTWVMAFLAALQFGVLTARCRGEHSPVRVATGAYPDLAVDRIGDLHLVYVRAGNLWYRHKKSDSDTWSSEENTGLPLGRSERSDPDVVTDSQRRPHVLVGSSYAWRDGETWRSIDPNVKRDTTLAIDSHDNVFVVRRGGHAGGHVGLRVRAAGTDRFTALPDPDIAGKLPLGRNDHVYAHLAIDPRDDSLHIVYRHGAPQSCTYRMSHDGGQTWAAEGICDDDREAPSVAIAPAGAVVVVTGTGLVFRRSDARTGWRSLGRAVQAATRDVPNAVVDSQGRIYVSCFGGRLNVSATGSFGQESRLPSLRGKPLGFVDLVASPHDSVVYAAWEEGDAVNNDAPSGDSDILVAKLNPAALVTETPQQGANQNTPANATPGKNSNFKSIQQVRLHGRFEREITNAQHYADPYREVTFEVELRRPDGRQVRWWGFYDGGTTWRFRYAPDQLGAWSYTARFSDGAAELSGSFECLPSPHPRIGIYHDNPVWFCDAQNRPLLIRGLHIGDRFFAANWPAEQRAAFLDWVSKNDYNLLSIGSHFLNRDEAGRGREWDTPKLWPVNAAEYRRMESLLDDLANRKLYVFPFAGFLGERSNYPRDPADQERYIRYTLARLAPYRNLLWNVAGPEPNVRPSWLPEADVQRLGRLIKSLDPLEHPISVHNRTGDDPYRDSDWSSYGVLQGPKTSDLAALSRGLLKNHHPAKPLLAQETLWSGNVNHIRLLGGRDYSDDELRKNAFVIHMSAAMLVFADNNGGKSSTGFSGTLDPRDANQPRHDIVRRVWDCLEALPTGRMKPRQDLVSRGFCLAAPEDSYLVYLATPEPVDVQLQGGPFRVEWIDPRAPKKRHAGGTTTSGQGLTPPDGGDDWLVLLTRTNP